MLRQPRSRSFGALSTIGALGLLSAGLSAGCGTATRTTTTDAWKDPSHAAGPLQNVVVVGEGMNATDRRTVEDRFVSSLAAHGVRATPSYALFPRDLPNAEAARAALGQSNADGLLIANMRGVSERIPYPLYDGETAPAQRYYGPEWSGPTYKSDTLVTDQYVKFETTLVDPRESGKVVWSVVTQTARPASARDFAASLTKAVVPALAKAGLVPPAPGEKT